MRFFVMRHGPAEDHAASGRDADRVLTARGRKRVSVMAGLLAREISEEKRVRVVTSPFARAHETAELVRAAIKDLAVDFAVRKELAIGGSALPLVAELAKDDVATVLVGHQPDLSDLIAEMTGVSVSMDKAMVAIIEWIGGKGELVSVLDPRHHES